MQICANLLYFEGRINVKNHRSAVLCGKLTKYKRTTQDRVYADEQMLCLLKY